MKALMRKVPRRFHLALVMCESDIYGQSKIFPGLLLWERAWPHILSFTHAHTHSSSLQAYGNTRGMVQLTANISGIVDLQPITTIRATVRIEAAAV